MIRGTDLSYRLGYRPTRRAVLTQRTVVPGFGRGKYKGTPYVARVLRPNPLSAYARAMTYMVLTFAMPLLGTYWRLLWCYDTNSTDVCYEASTGVCYAAMA